MKASLTSPDVSHLRFQYSPYFALILSSSVGAVLSSSSAAYLLLPGQYTSSVQPASLSQSLTSATSTLTFTTGFSNSTTPTTPTLPLNVALLPGLLNYPADLYSGDPTFIPVPQSVNATFNATLNRGSIIVAANTVAAIEANNLGVKNRVVLWDTVPYISQLPYSMAGSLQVLSIQSATCSPACSSSAICSTAGTCICPAGFTGTSCEACADGFWGPQCKREFLPPTCIIDLTDISPLILSLPIRMRQMRQRNHWNRCLSQPSNSNRSSFDLQLPKRRVLRKHLHLHSRLDDDRWRK